MANSRSALKRIRTSEKSRLRNQSAKSRVRTLVRKFEEAVVSGDQAAAGETFAEASSALDRAASKGILHQNMAARKKSRMASRLTSLSAD